LRLLDSAEIFHERTRMYFYPKIFANTSTKSEDWTKFKAEFLPPREGVNWVPMISPFVVLIVVFLGWALIRSKTLYSL
jgi:ABC-2 type transport system permease protein